MQHQSLPRRLVETSVASPKLCPVHSFTPRLAVPSRSRVPAVTTPALAWWMPAMHGPEPRPSSLTSSSASCHRPGTSVSIDALPKSRNSKSGYRTKFCLWLFEPVTSCASMRKAVKVNNGGSSPVKKKKTQNKSQATRKFACHTTPFDSRMFLLSRPKHNLSQKVISHAMQKISSLELQPLPLAAGTPRPPREAISPTGIL